jgi:hypothetical protein
VVIEANARRQPARGQICDPRAFCPHGRLAGNLWAEAVEVNRFRHPIRDVAFWSAIVAHPSRRADRLNPLPGVDSWKLGRVSQVITRYVEQDEIIRSLADRIQANGSGPKTPKQRRNDRNRSKFWTLSH